MQLFTVHGYSGSMSRVCSDAQHIMFLWGDLFLQVLGLRYNGLPEAQRCDYRLIWSNIATSSAIRNETGLMFNLWWLWRMWWLCPQTVYFFNYTDLAICDGMRALQQSQCCSEGPVTFLDLQKECGRKFWCHICFGPEMGEEGMSWSCIMFFCKFLNFFWDA